MRHVQLHLQICDPLCCRSVDTVFLHVDILTDLLIAQEGEDRHAGIRAKPVPDRLRDQRDHLLVVIKADRDPGICDPFLRLAGFLQRLGYGDLEFRSDKAEYIQRDSADGQRDKGSAVSIRVHQFVLFIHQDTGRHQHLQYAGVQFSR